VNLATHTQDDAFHEIQLNGKQLVFLFMAATVVSVVIFLCGVLVGRGVRAERGTTAADVASLSAVTAAETTPQQLTTPPPAAPPAGSDPTAAAPPPPADDLSYFNRLEKPNEQADDLKPAAAQAPTPAKPAVAEKNEKALKAEAVEKKKNAAAAAPAPEPAKPAAAEKAEKAEKAAAEPSGNGFAVQVAALNVRGEADAIANRLSSKGYAAYVLAPASGTPSVYRVRIGKFGTRREAEAMAAKLQKEEQFKPWITR